MSRHYCVRTDEDGYGPTPCDILLDHGLKNPDFRTFVIREEHWSGRAICQALNDAYEAGRSEAMRDLRRFMGIDK